MFNWLSMQQQQMWASSYPQYGATPFGYPSVPAFNADISALLATIGTPVAPKPAKVEKPENEPLQAKTTGVFGDLSNVLETAALASPAKSPSKSPTRRAADSENTNAPL